MYNIEKTKVKEIFKMTEYGKRAGELFEMGYNCAQSVSGAFAEKCGLPLDVITKLASSFGGGIAGRREMCGAVSGMLLVIGCIRGHAIPESAEQKQKHYAFSRTAMEKFEEKIGTIICRERLEMNKMGECGVHTCREICEIAADIVAEIID